MKVEFNWRDYDDYTKWLQDVLTTLYEENQELRDEKVKLLSENQQLKKQKDDVVEYIKKQTKNMPENGCKYRLNNILRMLGETNEFE